MGAYVAVLELERERCEYCLHRTTYHLLTGLRTDGLIVCEILECKLAPNPTVAQVGFVLDENVAMTPDPDAMIITLRLTSVSFTCYLIPLVTYLLAVEAPSLISLVPLAAAPHTVVRLRFERRIDYLSCLKAINDAEIARVVDREEAVLTLRHALSTVVPRHAPPDRPEQCALHARKFTSLNSASV